MNSATEFYLPGCIEHTLLRPEATQGEIEDLCQEAITCDFKTVCVLPSRVPVAVKYLLGSTVRVCSVLGFPLGATPTKVKLYEAQTLLDLGTQELDLVLNIGALKDGQDAKVQKEIWEIVHLSHQVHIYAGDLKEQKPVLVKVILETGHLTPEEVRRAAELAQAAGADMLKTSTGFGPRGASVADVRLLRQVVGDSLGIKASGGIRTWEFARELLVAGATRLGTSAGLDIYAQWQKQQAWEKPLF